MAGQRGAVRPSIQEDRTLFGPELSPDRGRSFSNCEEFLLIPRTKVGQADRNRPSSDTFREFHPGMKM